MPRYTRDVPEMCPTYARDTPEIHPRYASHPPQDARAAPVNDDARGPQHATAPPTEEHAGADTAAAGSAAAGSAAVSAGLGGGSGHDSGALPSTVSLMSAGLGGGGKGGGGHDEGSVPSVSMLIDDVGDAINAELARRRAQR